MLRVNTIYPAFMGEVNCHGIGVPCTFVRLSGCNLRCYKTTKGTTCDTPEALEVSCGDAMTEEEVMSKVTELGNNVICLTGGEPLLQDVRVLLEGLSLKGFNIVVETNGSQPIRKYRHIKNVSFVVDYKSKSSGENERMLAENWTYMDGNDFLKFVIDDLKDYTEAKMWLGSNLGFAGKVAFGLYWGAQISYQELMEFMHKDKLDVYLNMQTHKMACLYDVADNNMLSHIFIPKNL